MATIFEAAGRGALPLVQRLTDANPKLLNARDRNGVCVCMYVCVCGEGREGKGREGRPLMIESPKIQHVNPPSTCLPQGAPL